MKYLKKFRVPIAILCLILIVFNISTYFFSWSEYVSKIETTSTGVKDNVVTLNDLTNDWNYYKGLNYTQSDGTLPSFNNKNLYNENNLAEAKITYKGSNIEGNLKGYVSLTELQDTYIYYKVYPVNNNNTSILSDDFITIELIDTPFTNRPNNKAFNGWITDYQNAYIRYDSEYYKRYVDVPITYTNGIPNPIDITLYANWIDSTSVLLNNNWDTAFNSLKKAGMIDLPGFEYEYEYGTLDMSGYFYQVSISRNQSISGYYNSAGVLQTSGRCSSRTCTYYRLINNENFNSSNTYYELINGNMILVNNDSIELPIINKELITSTDAILIKICLVIMKN